MIVNQPVPQVSTEGYVLLHERFKSHQTKVAGFLEAGTEANQFFQANPTLVPVGGKKLPKRHKWKTIFLIYYLAPPAQ
jgi:hypothetical protein